MTMLRFLRWRLVIPVLLLPGYCAAGPPDPAARPGADRLGDALPKQAVGRLGTIRLRHGDKITALAVSPDGRLVASAGLDRFVHVWDAKTGRLTHSFHGEANYPASLAFSPDGRLLAANLEGEDVVIWELEKASRQATIKAGFVEETLFSPDGKALVCVERDGVYVRDRSTNKARFEMAGARSACLTRGGELIVGGAKGDVTMRDLQAGRTLRELSGGHDVAVTSVALSYHGKLLATSDGSKTCVWDLETAKVMRSFPAGGRVSFLPNSELVVIPRENKLLAFDAKGESTPIMPLPVSRYALSADGRLLAVAGESNVVHLWDLPAGKEITPVDGSESPVTSLAFVDGGRTLLAGDARRLRAWDIAERRQKESADIPAFRLDSATGSKLVAAGSSAAVHLWNQPASATGKLLPAPTSSIKVDADEISALSVSPDGKRVLFGAGKDRLGLADAAGKLERNIVVHGPPSAIAFAPNAGHAAILCRDGLLHMWAIDPRPGADGGDSEVWRKRVQRAPGGGVAFSPDGFLVAVSSRGRILILEATAGRQLFSLEREFGEGDVQALAFSPDGRMLAAGMGGHAGTVRLWETWSGKALVRYDGHSGSVNAVAFSGDGRLLASGAGDTTVLLWDVNTAGDSTKLEPIDLAKAWEQLDSQDIRAAYRAVNGLVAAGPKGVTTVRDGLKTADEGQAQINKWIAQLDAYQFRVRDNARRQLLAQGLRAVPALRAEQAKKLSPEAEAGLKSVFEELSLRGIYAPEGGLFGEPLRTVRAVLVLERIGGKEAKDILEQLAKGPPDVRATAEARAALARLRP